MVSPRLLEAFQEGIIAVDQPDHYCENERHVGKAVGADWIWPADQAVVGPFHDYDATAADGPAADTSCMYQLKDRWLEQESCEDVKMGFACWVRHPHRGRNVFFAPVPILPWREIVHCFGAPTFCEFIHVLTPRG